MQNILLKLRSHTFRHLLSAVLLSGCYYIIQLFFTKIISAKITVNDFGEYRYFFSILAFGPVFSIGFIDGFQTEWIVNKRPVNIKYVIASLLLTLFTSLISFFLFDSIEISLLLIANLIFVNAIAVCQFIFIKNNFFLYYLLPIIFSQLIQIILFVLLPEISLIEIFYIHTAINLLFISLTFVYCYNKKYIIPANSRAFSWSEILPYLKNGLPILVSGAVLIGFLNIDKLMIKGHYDEVEYGYYCFASLIALVLYGVFASLANMLLKKIVEAQSIERIYNNTIYLLLIIPFMVLAFHGVIIKCIDIFFPKYLPAAKYFTGFTNFYFPLLANNLVIFNTYKKHKQVSRFAFISMLFLGIQLVMLIWLQRINVALTDVPYLMSITMCVWFFVNDFFLSYHTPALYKKYWLRTAICLVACIFIFVITYKTQ